MNVEDNLGFGQAPPRPKPQRSRRVRSVAATLGLQALVDRRPPLLSGGQRQRVAMGRAMVREPTAFLMDEPLSNLDAKLARLDARRAGARLHEQLQGYDRVRDARPGQGDDARPAGRHALDGVLQPFRHPQRLFNDPTNLFVAAFIGSPSMDIARPL